MTSCPKCGKNGKELKKWTYGPKTRKGPTFTVHQYKCPNGHKWRKYEKMWK